MPRPLGDVVVRHLAQAWEGGAHTAAALSDATGLCVAVCRFWIGQEHPPAADPIRPAPAPTNGNPAAAQAAKRARWQATQSQPEQLPTRGHIGQALDLVRRIDQATVAYCERGADARPDLVIAEALARELVAQLQRELETPAAWARGLRVG